MMCGWQADLMSSKPIAVLIIEADIEHKFDNLMGGQSTRLYAF